MGCCSTASVPLGSPCSPSAMMQTTSRLSSADRRDHLLARLGVDRMGHLVRPGLYELGHPDRTAQVIVTANYTLTFDAVRSALDGIDVYLLVLDTYGVNVWCAAGKGTFGTDELVRRIEATGLAGVVDHRRVILPQFGAPGVSAPEVVRRSDFRVEWGPVRARDLPAYLANHTATPEMRQVRFPLRDRLVLIPVDLRSILLMMVAGAVVLWLLAGLGTARDLVVAMLTGTILFPILLPYLPTRDFTTRGYLLGMLVMIPSVLLDLSQGGGWLVEAGRVVVDLTVFPAITAYLALLFTGATPFTSRTGVRREIFRYIRPLAGIAVVGIVTAVALRLVTGGV
ncbi:mercury methylation corrinoid protein HgcA [Methanosphaerula palustris]